MAHQDIWDDSALVDSWNQALDEYKKYHSIHKKGGTVDDVSPSQIPPNATAPGDAVGETDGKLDLGAGHSEGSEVRDVPAEGEGPGIGSMFVPPSLFGSVRDEGLKRLLMSWYYAGYYTGLYEGQRQTQQNSDREGAGS